MSVKTWSSAARLVAARAVVVAMVEIVCEDGKQKRLLKQDKDGKTWKCCQMGTTAGRLSFISQELKVVLSPESGSCVSELGHLKLFFPLL